MRSSPAKTDFNSTSRTVLRQAKKKFRVKAEGMSTVEPREVLTELARLVANGELKIPVYATYPLDRVRAAYERLGARHGLGKIVLEVRSADSV